MPSVFRALLFDFDGVLAATMEDNYQAWRRALADYSANLTPDEYYPLEGMALSELARRYCAGKGIDQASVPAIVAAKERYYVEHHSFHFYPGVEDFISKARARGIPMAVVTTGHLPRLQASVPDGFLDRFAAVVSGDQIARGKPYPDPYEKGASLLGIPIDQCIAVENSPLGVESAKRAGAFCVGITSTVSATMLNDADAVIPDFAHLADVPCVADLIG